MDVQLIVKATVVLAVRLLEVPVIVTVAVPTAAVLLAVSVSKLVAVAGLVPNPAVTPVGRPDAASVAVPVNPFLPETVMVVFPVAPWARANEAGEALKAKLGAGLTVKVTLAVVAA